VQLVARCIQSHKDHLSSLVEEIKDSCDRMVMI